MRDIKAYLNSYIAARKYAEICFREWDEAEQVSLQSPKMDGMPRVLNPHGLEVQVARSDALRRRAEAEREKVLRMLEDIEMRIFDLPNYNQRLVIRLHYIQGLSWDEVAQEMHYSKSRVYAIHGQALTEMRRNESERSGCAGGSGEAGDQPGEAARDPEDVSTGSDQVCD